MKKKRNDTNWDKKEEDWKKIEQNISDSWNNIKQSNTDVIEVPEGKQW